ncbi:hypothetical protein [Granulicella sp. S156]|uniref:hypothetical protein n=1 Tax=Granulicella sp. S156 TaxID=1747224 RepID=UPI00131AEAD9|nr:hypothetical protein [Granulicella sp. S156]
MDFTSKRAKYSCLFYLIPLTGILILLFAFGWTNILDIDWDAGTAVSTNRFLLGFSRARTMTTGNIEHAIIEYDRMGPRIALALKGEDASKFICTAILIGVLELGMSFKPNALPRPTPITPPD